MKDVVGLIDKNKEVMVIPDAIVVIGKDLNVIVFNEAASRITGFTEEEILGGNYDVLFRHSEEDKGIISECLLENRSFSNLSINITCANNTKKNVLASINPIRKENKPISAVLTFRDTKEMITMYENLEAKTLELIIERNKLDAIFNSNIEGTFTIDKNWTITSFNNSAVKITGYNKSEAIGRKCWEIFRSNKCRNGCHMESTMHNGRASIGNELEIIHKSGRKVPIKVNSSVLANDKNEKCGAVETFMDITELKNLSDHLIEKFKFENIIGKSKELNQVVAVLESVANTNSTVLLTGESGTGKELAARAIHLNSLRRNGPFVTVNCSAFVESLIESELFGHEKGAFTGAITTKIGRFELARGGTIFLDEIGDLTPSVQTKLLRVIETLEFERVGGTKNIKTDARIIAATNKNLTDEILAGRFRDDLYYRINVINIHLPPLRERRDDLPLLINHFIEHFNKKFGKNIKQFNSKAYDVLLEYDWKGNIRELENVIEHCFILCSSDIIQPEHLPKRLRLNTVPVVESESSRILSKINNTEREVIISALDKNKWNRKQTADYLGINTSTLWRKMKKLKINY
ncbi:MAG: sigma 54-interacting transcriptional regulator [Melioribacteraceae bacterium]|nr:sigma 54-interacting transcriptional regulator [Melioribacteraceae bacterium]